MTKPDTPDPPSAEAVAACYYHTRSTLGYIAWHRWAERRARKGDKQTQCPDCKLWLFPEEWGDPDD